MSLRIHADPQERAGGFAFLELADGSLPNGSVKVAVFDAYGERWLAPSERPGERIGVGDPNWQSVKAEFGPYEVHRHDGADWVRIGPEIVNKLEEYAPLRITLGEHTYDVTWPDDVPARAGAAVLGGLQTVARKQADQNSERLVGKVQTETSEDTAQVVDDAADQAKTPDPQTRRGSLLIPFLVLLAALIAAVVWYLWPQGAPRSTSGSSEPACSFAALSTVSGGFDKTAEAIRACGADVSADTALRLIEEASAKEDGSALLLFGTLYDGSQLDPKIEKLIGLTFDDDPAQAVEYYARAVKAGSGQAQQRLAATCKILSVSNATLAKGAYDDFCR